LKEVTTMQAYAKPATVSPSHLRLLNDQLAADQNGILDLLLDQLAARVAAQIAAKLAAADATPANQWLDSRSAAEYLNISRDSVRRLAAEGTLPTEQAGTNCKLYFRRSDLDAWRRGGSTPTTLRRVA